MSKLVAEEYLSSLTDLTVNSKPLINMLTMLADENVDHAPAIVQVIESHLEKVQPEVKLPILYLIDSIIKNVSKVYVPLFTQNIVNIFVSVFEKVDETTRLNMYKLRQTWADVFPARKLYVLDLRVKDIDHAWPVTAPTPTSIHFNPKFLGNKSTVAEVASGTPAPPQTTTPTTVPVTTQSTLKEQLLKKQKILNELQQKKLELELMQTKAMIEGQENKLNEASGQGLLQNLARPAINEEAAKIISQRAAAKPKAVVMPPSNSSKLSSATNSAQNKTKIAPANTQLIEAAKSRDPRIAKQQQSKISEVTHKEQEIFNRQLAMLKTPLAEQVAPVVPAQKVLVDSSAKGHITFNVQGSLEKERLDAKNKKQIKETVKTESSTKNKSKQNFSKEFKGSPSKSSKNSSSNTRNSSKNDSKRAKSSNYRQSRSQLSKASHKKLNNRPPGSPSKCGQNAAESLVSVSGKDVDLRLLNVRSGSPKKRSPEAVVEEPPKKKNKSEIFDELFGSEDVDLRKITRGTINIEDRLPSPPPPPVISNGPSAPQVAAIAPLVVEENSNKGESPREFSSDDQISENAIRDRDGFDSAPGRYRKSWADVKVKPEAEIKPMPLSDQLELELGQRKDTYNAFDSPEKGPKKHFRDKPSPRGELDRLGRPLLYNKLPNDPRARRESLGVLDGRDTDMRRLGNLMDRDLDTNINVNMIIAQAADQVRNGTMSPQEYNELLKQVIQVNEKQKLREAQNKSRQEIRRTQHHHRNRRSPNRFGPPNRNSPPFRHDDDRRDRRPFNDIDERLQMPAGNFQQHNDSAPGFSKMPYMCGSNRSPFDVPNYDDRLVKSDIWSDDKNRFRRPNEMDSLDNRIRDVMCSERTHDCVDVPPADPQVLEMIAKDPMKSITIDGTARDIRFYGDTAVVMLSWDDPKEISFKDGIRRVLIGDMSIVCALNDPCIMFMLNGNPHSIRLGAPTRELYIDGNFYEAHFGGPPVQVQIDGLSYLVQLEGPPPQVKIGKKRTDLICGRVNMIVDAAAMLPLYLDAKPQRFDLKNRPYIFRLVNSLKTLLVNEVPVDIQFGGGCRQICGYGNLHFLRLSVLPNGIEPGCVQIVNMECLSLPSVANIIDNVTPSGTASPPINNIQQNFGADMKPMNQGFDIAQQPPVSRTIGGENGGALDILTSLISGVSAPEQSVGFNYQIENKDKPQLSQSAVARPDADAATSQAQLPTAPLLGSGLNINDLFQRLVASGIVPTLSSTVNNNQKSQNSSAIKPIDFSDPNSLRERQPPLINLLYSGIQCSSCGVRFSPEETVKYSRHLDWHFRQNRRDKDAARKGQSRKWYYDVSDWIQFAEIEDLEERAQSWFEVEATNNGEDNTEEAEVKSVPAPSGHDFTLCELCRDEFETYYNEEKEEWHLKPCILVEGKYYHPLCYEDLVNMPEDSLPVDKTTDSIGPKDELISENAQGCDESKETMDVDEYKPEMSDLTAKSSESDEFIELKTDSVENTEEDSAKVIGTLLNELINCIVFKNEMESKEEEKEEDKLSDNEETKEDEEEEIEVLESVPAEQKKNIIDVDLIEKLDDEDDVVYQRKTPSPITLIPPAKIKQEPVDEMESPVAVVDQTYTNVVSSIDGNVEMIDAPQVAPSAPSRIKITFNKPLPTESQTEKQEPKQEVPDSAVEENDPDPLPLKPKKPRIAEREMTVYLPVVKGTEESGLCSIM